MTLTEVEGGVERHSEHSRVEEDLLGDDDAGTGRKSAI